MTEPKTYTKDDIAMFSINLGMLLGLLHTDFKNKLSNYVSDENLESLEEALIKCLIDFEIESQEARRN